MATYHAKELSPQPGFRIADAPPNRPPGQYVGRSRSSWRETFGRGLLEAPTHMSISAIITLLAWVKFSRWS